MATPLVLSCDVADLNATTGECVAPYYAPVPTALPPLTAEEGLKIAFAIVLFWIPGLIARYVIRASQLNVSDRD